MSSSKNKYEVALCFPAEHLTLNKKQLKSISRQQKKQESLNDKSNQIK
jgi:hypothetical protein